MSHEPITVTSEYGDLRVAVFYPAASPPTQGGVVFARDVRPGGMDRMPRVDLLIVEALLQDALDETRAVIRRRSTEVSE